MIRMEFDVSLPDEDDDLATVALRAAQSLDLGDGAVIHRMTVEQVAA